MNVSPRYKPGETCRVDGCAKLPGKGKNGYCYMHINRMRKHGHLGPAGMTRPVGVDAESKLRFYGWSEQETGCWEWQGPRSHDYGALRADGEVWLAHRLSYSVFVGPIPDGDVICHRCDNPICINPAHLFPGTQAVNLADMRDKGRGVHGSAQHAAILTDNDVREIRDKKASGVPATVLALRYGVHKRQIYKIVNREQWKHVI